MTPLLTDYQFWSRVIRMAAAIIGASLALWWLAGDRDVDAAGDDYSRVLTLSIHDTYDLRGIKFYEFRDATGVGFTISADGDIALAKWLDTRNKQRVVLTIQTHTDLRRDGQ